MTTLAQVYPVTAHFNIHLHLFLLNLLSRTVILATLQNQYYGYGGVTDEPRHTVQAAIFGDHTMKVFPPTFVGPLSRERIGVSKISPA